MSLNSGEKLGAYEILSPLGAGGMGEVYRARDPKLGRDVALKVLPDTVSRDAERMARFRREAQILASLNQPNIAAIYGFEDSGDRHALVMELVEGPTLAELLKQRPLPVDEALQVARQIAEALEYAHEKGIIHRDLKPANVKLTAEGGAKILDFGLAKAFNPQESASAQNQSDSPTLSVGGTQAGVILGTAAYMSPEQAKGKSVDRRADIWAFGCVLFEMLAGKAIFEGETTSEVLAAVIRDQPDWNALPQTTPPRIRELARRCLAKDAKQRLQAIGEARIAIEEALSGDGALTSTAALASGTVTQVEAPAPRRGFIALLGFAAMVLAVLAGHFLWRAPAPPAWTGVLLGGPQVASLPRLSPDGRMLAFVAADNQDVIQLWVMQPDSGNRIMLTHRHDRGYVQDVSWSPDGSRIYFDRWYNKPNGVYSVPSLGGDEHLVLDDALDPAALPDGGLLVLRRTQQNLFQIVRYSPETGQSQPYNIAFPDPTAQTYERAVPGGHDALMIGAQIGPGAVGGRHLFLVDLASGSVRQLPEDSPDQFGGNYVAVAPTRDGKYAIESTVHGSMYRIASVALDGKSPPQPLFEVSHSIMALDTGPDGSIYLDQLARAGELVRFSPQGGRAEKLAGSAVSEDVGFCVLPDGRAVWAERTSSGVRLLLVEPGKDPVPLVNSAEETTGPMTAVGADQVAFLIGKEPHHTIALAAVSSGSITQRLDFNQGEVTAMTAAPDGKTIYCVAAGVVWSVPLSGGEPRKIRSGDTVTVDPSTQSLVIEVREPPKTRLVSVPLGGGPEREISANINLGFGITTGSIRDGKLVAPMGSDTWNWPPAIFDLASGKSTRIPLDYTNDFHRMAWTPDGKIMAVAYSLDSTLWKFTPASQ